MCTYAQQGYVFGRIGLCMYVCIFVYVKNRLFSVLLLENLQLIVFYYFSLSLNASIVVCYVQRVVQTEQFMLFQN